MKFGLLGPDESQTNPSSFPWYCQYWDKHSQHEELISQHEIGILGTKTNPKLDPTTSHDIFQYWDKHSQCSGSISQHQKWICFSQWNPNELPIISQDWDTNSHNWVMNLGILWEFPIWELGIFSCAARNWISHTNLLCSIKP